MDQEKILLRTLESYRDHCEIKENNPYCSFRLLGNDFLSMHHSFHELVTICLECTKSFKSKKKQLQEKAPAQPRADQLGASS